MKKLSVFLLVFVVLTVLSYAEQLKVTPEHPFYLDGKWVEASELEVGDVLKTYDGKRAVIKNIRKVKTEKPITVYNLEDDFYLHNYVVDKGLIVHNSLTGDPRSMSSAELDSWYEKKVLLERLSREQPGAVVEIEGGFKKVYVIDGRRLDYSRVPSELRGFIPRNKRIAVKYLERSAPEPLSMARLNENFDTEIQAMNRVNRIAERGEKPFPRMSKYGYEQTCSNTFVSKKGVQLQEGLSHESAKMVFDTLEPGVWKNTRAKGLWNVIVDKLRYEEPRWDAIFRQAGVFWDDGNNINIVIGFSKDGIKYPMSRVLSSAEPIETFKISVKAVEAGSAQIRPGNGAFAGFVNSNRRSWIPEYLY